MTPERHKEIQGIIVDPGNLTAKELLWIAGELDDALAASEQRVRELEAGQANVQAVGDTIAQRLLREQIAAGKLQVTQLEAENAALHQQVNLLRAVGDTALDQRDKAEQLVAAWEREASARLARIAEEQQRVAALEAALADLTTCVEEAVRTGEVNGIAGPVTIQAWKAALARREGAP